MSGSHPVNTPSHDLGTIEREEGLLTVSALLAVAITATVVPLSSPHTSAFRAVAPIAPAAFAATLAWTRGHRRLFAPPAALIAAAVISGLLAVVRGTSWILDPVVAFYILGTWLPWPRWHLRSLARPVLWALTIAPVLVLIAAQLLGWSDPWQDLLAGNRIHSAYGKWNLTAMSLLWGVLAAEVLRRAAARYALAAQAVNLVLLGATGSRVVAVAAGGVLAVLLWRDRREGLTSVIRRRWVWGLFAVPLIPRVLDRLFVTASGPTSGGRDATEAFLNYRDVIWGGYLADGRDFLLTGGGIGLPQRISGDRPELEGFSTHNEYLWLALSVGVLGVALVAAAWFVAFRARVPWVVPNHPELLAPAALLPVMALVEDPLLALTFPQPYLILLAASATFASIPDNYDSSEDEPV